MRVNKPRGNNQVRGINNLFRSIGNLADCGNFAIGYRDISLVALSPGPVNHGSVFNE
jgi:hypothetical protein